MLLGNFLVSTVYCNDPVLVPREYAQTFLFTIDAKQLGNSAVVSSPRISLEGLTSSVQFQLKNRRNVSITLIPGSCASSEPLYVQASITLLGPQSREDTESKSATVSKHLVEKTRCLPIYLNFVDYDDLLANYTEYGNATFEIEIAVDRVHPNLRPRTFGVVGRKFLFELRNVNLNSTGANRITAPVFNVRDITWSLYAEKWNGSLGVYLKANEYDLSTWFYKVDATFALLSFKQGVDPMKYTFTHTYSVASPIHGNGDLISLPELFDTNKQYIFNNKLNLLVDIHVE